MPVATHVLQGDFSALVGEVATIRATIHTNSTDDAWVNDTDDEIRLGGALLALASDGSFTVTLPTSTGTGLQYQVTAEYVNANRQRKTWQSGWFDLTANADLADKANDSTLRINTTLGDQLAARIDGYVDHGDVSDTLTVDPATGTHVLNATGALLVTLAEEANGTIVTLYVIGGAENVTVDGIADLELTDGAFASFVRIRSAWVLASAGASGTPATPDTTPPTAVTDLVATGGSEQIVGTWSAATDPETTVRYYWRVWPTSGGATGTYTMTTGTTFTKTGLAAGNYTAQVYSSSNGGTTTPDTATATVTAPPAPLTETFTRPDGTDMLGQTSTTGGYNWGADSTGITMFSAGSNTGTVSGGKYVTADGAARAIAAVFVTPNCTLTADYDVSSNGADKVAVCIAGTSNASAINVIVNRAWGEIRMYVDGGEHVATAASFPNTGSIEVSYSGTTATVKINGATVMTVESLIRTGSRVGLAVYSGATLDNVVVTPL